MFAGKIWDKAVANIYPYAARRVSAKNFLPPENATNGGINWDFPHKKLTDRTERPSCLLGRGVVK